MSEQKDELIIAKRVKKDSLVVTRNTMAYASYSNDPNQEKLMFAAMIVIRKLELENKGPIDPNSKIRISARNYAELTHKKVISGEATALEEAELKLIEKTADKALLRIYNKFQPLIMKVKEPDSPVPAKVPMITYCKYIAKSKSIDIRFAPEFYEYFYRVLVDQADDKKLDGYFSHELKQVTQLDGFYSMRIYRMLIENKWKSNILEISLDDLKFALDLEDKPSYNDIDNLKRRIIKPSIKEINDLSNITILKVENIKSGLSIVGLRFNYEYKASDRIKKIEDKLHEFKTKLLKAGIPYNDDGSHFKSPDREKYINRIDSFTPKQIGFLVSCPQFLNDYSEFYAGSTTDDEVSNRKLAKEILATLLRSKPSLLNDIKLIDFDYYVHCQLNNGLLNLQKNEKERDGTEDDIESSVNELEI
jgi:hypothetical protein